jgi:hypothetical protein
MRFVGAVLLALAALFGVGLITGEHANAATSAAPPPVIAPPGGVTLTQQPDGTWATSVFLDTAALCNVSFDLFTGAPDTDKAATQATYFDASTIIDASTSTAPCGSGPPAVTEVKLTFPAMPGGAIPQTATLAVTPSAANIAAGADPVEMTLTVRRLLIGASSLWFTFWFGLACVVALILLIEVYRAWKDKRSRVDFWGRGLCPPSKKWTFGGSWVTNFTALAAALAGVLTAAGAVSGMVPGVDLGRIVLLFAVVGASALLAPIVFAAVTRHRPAPAGGIGDVVVPRASMVAASCFTAFGVGAEIGLIGWVLGANLSAVSWEAHDGVRVVTFAVAGLFVFLAFRSIHEMPEQPPDTATVGGAGGETASDPVPTVEATSSS